MSKWIKIIILFLPLMVVGCSRAGLAEAKTNNPDYEVRFLFECDGVRVYRFTDGLTYRYFTSRGETISSHKRDKNTYIYENIQ